MRLRAPGPPRGRDEPGRGPEGTDRRTGPASLRRSRVRRAWTTVEPLRYDPRAMRHTFFFYDSPA